MNKLTIQINNLEALERLIGGNSEVEIEVRNSVVQRFAEKHLKPLANSEAIQNTFSSIKKELNEKVEKSINDQICSFKQEWYGKPTITGVKPEVQAEINRKVRDYFDKIVHEAIQKAIDEWSKDAKVDERIEKRVAYFTDDYIRQEVKTRIDKLKASM